MSDLPDVNRNEGSGMTVETVTPQDSASMPALASWQDQDPVLRDLWLKNQTPQAISDVLGRSVPAIMTRAARLGLPRRSAPGRKPSLRNPDGSVVRSNSAPAIRRTVPAHYAPATDSVPQTSMRVCLMCLTKFESMGRHNRICSPCKGSSEYESATTMPELHVPTS